MRSQMMNSPLKFLHDHGLPVIIATLRTRAVACML